MARSMLDCKSIFLEQLSVLSAYTLECAIQHNECCDHLRGKKSEKH